jgi:hypothetical protein
LIAGIDLLFVPLAFHGVGRDVAQIPARGPKESREKAHCKPTNFTAEGMSRIVTVVRRNPRLVWKVKAVPMRS